ncbi:MULTISPECIES: LysE family translocator [Pacificibacter]|uniref:LysE family translocator n=1 Tax=Pacificibacter TaxID=1042323 RepID=UPI001C094BA7|nr:MULTISPECIES: LysE family translocator [Pacificibacter]MBU2937073.1 LysE family translocator [Pacificibacter marinus]MDO6616387.1 LysE family translocator [Pacificibacter sp. 1_MG-2023]
MPFDLWIAFATASLALIIIPGPTVLLVLSYALGQGRRVAVASAVGVGLGDVLAMTASLLGLGVLIMTSALAFTVIKWIGGAYLLYLGVNMLRSAGSAQMGSLMRTENVSERKVFSHAFIVTALNPKSIGFFIAFVPHFITAEAALAPQFTVMIATFASLGFLNALCYALLAGSLRNTIATPRVLRNLTRGGGLALITMSALTVSLKRS